MECTPLHLHRGVHFTETPHAERIFQLKKEEYIKTTVQLILLTMSNYSIIPVCKFKLPFNFTAIKKTTIKSLKHFLAKT